LWIQIQDLKRQLEVIRVKGLGEQLSTITDLPNFIQELSLALIPSAIPIDINSERVVNPTNELVLSFWIFLNVYTGLTGYLLLKVFENQSNGYKSYTLSTKNLDSKAWSSIDTQILKTN
jgi:hypothetical protein